MTWPEQYSNVGAQTDVSRSSTTWPEMTSRRRDSKELEGVRYGLGIAAGPQTRTTLYHVTPSARLHQFTSSTYTYCRPPPPPPSHHSLSLLLKYPLVSPQVAADCLWLIPQVHANSTSVDPLQAQYARHPVSLVPVRNHTPAGNTLYHVYGSLRAPFIHSFILGHCLAPSVHVLNPTSPCSDRAGKNTAHFPSLFLFCAHLKSPVTPVTNPSALLLELRVRIMVCVVTPRLNIVRAACAEPSCVAYMHTHTLPPVSGRAIDTR